MIKYSDFFLNVSAQIPKQKIKISPEGRWHFPLTSKRALNQGQQQDEPLSDKPPHLDLECVSKESDFSAAFSFQNRRPISPTP